MTIGEQIKQLRKEKGLTQEKLSELINMKGGKTTIYNYEKGLRFPSIEILNKIAEVLGCELIIELREQLNG